MLPIFNDIFLVLRFYFFKFYIRLGVESLICPQSTFFIITGSNTKACTTLHN